MVSVFLERYLGVSTVFRIYLMRVMKSSNCKKGSSFSGEGNVPLWEAIIGRHYEISKLLSENGAMLSFDTIGHFF